MSVKEKETPSDAEVIALAAEMGLDTIAKCDPAMFGRAWKQARGYAERRLRPASVDDEPAASFRVADGDEPS